MPHLQDLIAAAGAVVAAKAALDAAPRTPDGYINGSSDEYKACVWAEHQLSELVRDHGVLAQLAAVDAARAELTGKIERLTAERDEARASLDDFHAATRDHITRCPLAQEAWAFIRQAVAEIEGRPS